jgi:hypothetical protein
MMLELREILPECDVEERSGFSGFFGTFSE